MVVLGMFEENVSLLLIELRLSIIFNIVVVNDVKSVIVLGDF